MLGRVYKRLEQVVGQIISASLRVILGEGRGILIEEKTKFHGIGFFKDQNGLFKDQIKVFVYPEFSTFFFVPDSLYVLINMISFLRED